MPTAYRIVKSRRVADAFTGEGLRRQGGRWTNPGRRAVYLAESAALAALEMLVHLDSAAVLQRYILFRVDFEDRLVTTVNVGTLPADWRNSPAPRALQGLGDEWHAAAESALLQVPSAIIPIESCYVLNPGHTEFAQVTIGDPMEFLFDARLGRD